ncbi:MAG: GDP-mannose 4,6-dehydratase, partial [Candidatus Nitrosocaldus sp.]
MLITGGAGFIGSHLVDRLLAYTNDADNLNVHVLDNLSTGNIAHVRRWSSNSSFRFFKLDLVSDDL